MKKILLFILMILMAAFVTADGIDSNTVLMLHADGDESGSDHTYTAYGNSQLVSSGKFDGAMSFDGDGDYLSIPANDDWNFGSDSFTIDFWVKQNTGSNGGILSSNMNTGVDWRHEGGKWLVYSDSNNNKISFLYSTSSTTHVGNDITGVSSNVWYHIAVVRSGNTIYLYRDGTQVNSFDVTGQSFNSYVLGIGNQGPWGLSQNNFYYDGDIDELRISKGIARWDSAFTPDTIPYNISTDTCSAGSEDATATHTSATSSTGTVVVSSRWSTTYDGWKAFDGITTGDNIWEAAIATGWLRYELTSPKTIVSYNIYPYGYTGEPKDWTFEGSNDMNTWTVLDTRTGQTSWTQNVPNSYSFSNDVAYSYYRFDFTANNGRQWLDVSEIELIEQSCPTKLLLSFEGDVSDSGHDITFNGDADVSASTSKFDGSYYFDGTGDYLSIPDSSDWDFGSDDFTIDTWVRFSSLIHGGAWTDTETIVNHLKGSTDGWALYWESHTEDLRLYFWDPTTTLRTIGRSWTPSDNVWYHIAVVRSGNNFSLYVDGEKLGSDEVLDYAIKDGTLNTHIGMVSDGSEPRLFNGYIDELRISKGIARWTSAFTPDTVPYSVSSVVDPTYTEFSGDGDTTDFSAVDVTAVVDPILADSNVKVEWKGTFDLDGADLDSAVDFSSNFVSVDSVALAALNAVANITMKGTSYDSVDVYYILKDGVACGDCVKHSANPVKFEVSGFSNYTTGGNSTGIPEFSTMTLGLGLITVLVGLVFIRRRK